MTDYNLTPYVKILGGFTDEEQLQKAINDFFIEIDLAIEELIDIKYSSNVTYDSLNERVRTYHDAMIIYKWHDSFND